MMHLCVRHLLRYYNQLILVLIFKRISMYPDTHAHTTHPFSCDGGKQQIVSLVRTRDSQDTDLALTNNVATLVFHVAGVFVSAVKQYSLTTTQNKENLHTCAQRL